MVFGFVILFGLVRGVKNKELNWIKLKFFIAFHICKYGISANLV